MTTCETLENLSTFADLLVWPTSCSYYFYLIIFLVYMVIIGWGIYKFEEKRKGDGDFLSAFATSSLAFAVLGIFGTLVKSTAGIPMIQSDILAILLAITIPLNAFWIWKNK